MNKQTNAPYLRRVRKSMNKRAVYKTFTMKQCFVLGVLMTYLYIDHQKWWELAGELNIRKLDKSRYMIEFLW